MNMQQLATRAYRRLGILPAGGVPTDDQMTQAIQCYNAMAIGAQADGPSIFRRTQETWTILPATGSPTAPFVTPAIIMGLMEARVVVTPAPDLFERELGVVEYMDYMQLPNKLASNNQSTQICIDKQVTQTNIYVYPLATYGETINATVVRQVNSVQLQTDPIDFPQEWLEDLGYALADRLMDDEGVAAADPKTADRITQRAVAFYEKLMSYDRPTSIFIRPWGRAGSGRFYRRG
jgi:hypothetical protein